MIFIPIEVKTRDLVSRLWLACALVNKGQSVVFGRQREVMSFARRSSDGCYFDKSISSNKLNFYNQLIGNNIRIAAIDEEGLSCVYNMNAYLTHRMSDCTLPLVEKLFVWGSVERNLIIENKLENVIPKILVSGNPRFEFNVKFAREFWKEEVTDLGLRYGKFIFFASSFSIKTPLGGVNEMLKNLQRLGRIDDWQSRAEYRKKLTDIERVQLHCVRLLISICQNFPKTNVIIRPHPAESDDAWDPVLNLCSNARIERRFDITPWCIASDIFLHSSCTTALEAMAVGAKVISFVPEKNIEFAEHISNKVGHYAESAESVLSLLKTEYGKKVSDLEDHVRDGEHSFARYCQDFFMDSSATEHISSSLVQLGGSSSIDLFCLFKYRLRHLKRVFTLRKLTDEEIYTEQKCSKINFSEIQRYISRFVECGMIAKAPKAKCIAPNIFLISQEKG